MTLHTAQSLEIIERQCIDASAKLANLQLQFQMLSQTFICDPTDENTIEFLRIGGQLNLAYNEYRDLQKALYEARRND